MGDAMKKFEPEKKVNILLLNLIVIYIFNFLWSFGNPMINLSTMITAFFDNLNAKPIVFGLLQLCSSLPVLIQFLPRFIRLNKQHPKKLLFVLYEINGVGYIVYGVMILLLKNDSVLLILLLLILYFLIFCISQLASIMYLNYISNIFPSAILGRFYGVKGFLMSIGSVCGGIILSYMLKAVSFPLNYGVMYIVAGVFFMVATFFILFSVDKSTAVQSEKSFSDIKSYVKYMSEIIKLPIVKTFAFLMILIYMNNAPYTFALVFLNREYSMGIDPSIATLIAYFSQSILIVIVGQMIDKLGRSITVALYLTVISAANLVILIPFKQSYIFVFAVYGMYALFISMVKVRIANEVIPQNIRFDVIIFVNVAGVVVSSILSLAYGGLVQAFGRYEFIFIISALSIVFVYFVTIRLNRQSKEIILKQKGESK